MSVPRPRPHEAERPAILGGRKLVEGWLRVTEPTLPPWWRLLPDLMGIWQRRWLTNGGPVERELERQLAAMLETRHVVSAANGTLALMAALRAVAGRGEVLVPAVGFSATVHAILAAGATPRFVDVDPESWLLTPSLAQAAVTSSTVGILAVHLYGQPCDSLGLEAVASRHGLALLFDAAHAFGSVYASGRPIGSAGMAEAFSFHATKVLTSGEGGAVSTNDPRVARACRQLLAFGDAGTGYAEQAAWNGKLSELHALLALRALPMVNHWIARREQIAARYRANLAQLPGLRWQATAPGSRTNHQFVPLAILRDEFGLSADQLVAALKAEGIELRRYFAPALHEHPAFRAYAHIELPVAQHLARTLVCLPIYSHMSLEHVDRVCQAIHRVYVWREHVATQVDEAGHPARSAR